MVNLEMRAIRYFITVVEAGSFRVAAKMVNISQPAMSSAIQQLEELLDVKLLERTPQGIKTTIFGDSLYERAKVSRAELKMALDEIKMLQGVSKGKVSIGAGHSMIGGLLPGVVLQVQKDHPGVQISITEGMEKPLIEAVAKGDLDFAICSAPDQYRTPELKYEELYNSPIVAIVRSGHPLTKKKAVTVSDLVKYPWVLADPRMEPRGFEFFRCSLGKLSETVIETDSVTMMKNLAQQSNFVTFMPEMIISLEESDGRLVVLKNAPSFTGRHINVITRKNSYISPAAAIILREIREACDKLGLKK